MQELTAAQIAHQPFVAPVYGGTRFGDKYENWNNVMIATVLSDLVCFTLGVLGAIVALLVVQFIHFCFVLEWTSRRTAKGEYFRLSKTRRQNFKTWLSWHARLLSPLLHLSAKISRFRFANATIQYQDLTGPKGSCSEESFASAIQYQPRPEDVFVATQMKCGTTWMQHVVLQVLMRGSADLSTSGVALGALSPWLESDRTVDVHEAPLIGLDRPSRIIKTHLPAPHLTDSAVARYIYVARHPVSCFASCVDFLRANLGPFAPDWKDCEEWFRSDETMWFGTWHDHVTGWWNRGNQMDNVLIVRFEDMVQDLPTIVHEVASFLELDELSDNETDEIVRKCSFEYMSENADCFEMQPPHLLQHASQYFVSGSSNRHEDVPIQTRQNLLDWCRRKSHGSEVPADALYSDLSHCEQVSRR